MLNRLSNIYIKGVKCVSYFDRVINFLSIFYDFVNIGIGLFGNVNQVPYTFPCLFNVIFIFFKKGIIKILFSFSQLGSDKVSFFFITVVFINFLIRTFFVNKRLIKFIPFVNISQNIRCYPWMLLKTYFLFRKFFHRCHFI